MRRCLTVATSLLASASVAGQPASWLAAIAGADMLYTPLDSLVPSNNMPMIGNGFAATQVMSSDIYVSGLYNGYLTSDPSHRARIPALHAVFAPGATCDAGIHVRNATYYRRSYIDPQPGQPCTNATVGHSCTNAPSRIWVEQRWYIHRALPSVMVMEVEVLDADAAVHDYPGVAQPWQRTGLPMDAPLAMLQLVNVPGGPSDDITFVSVPVSPSSPYTIVNGSTKVAETNTSGLQAVAVLSTAWPANNMLAVASAGVTTAFIGVIRTSIETPPAQLVAAVEADFAVAMQFADNGTLHSTHILEWAQTIWPSGYETDRIDVARAVNTSIYAIVSSARADRPYGVGPGGLTAGYNGHVFWDCDIWMSPGINLLLPDIAESFIQYRLNRMQGARDKAASYSPPYSGLMFPWESALTGEETCPSWAATGIREDHISGDIAVEVWQHWRATQDNSNGWLTNVGYPLLSGIADFWVSKAIIDTPGAIVPGWNATQQTLARSSACDAGCSTVPNGYGEADPGTMPMHIADVIPPDEYADHVTDSVYTNAVAILSMQHATDAAIALGMPASTYAAWQNVSQRLVMVYNATAPGIVGGMHPEYAGYFNDTVKQADTILLGFPLGVTFGNLTAQSYANDLFWYARVTDDNGPAMTWGMFCIGSIILGDLQGAAGLFNRSFANAQPPFDVWTETPTGGTPNFLTGAGGFLQVPLFGYSQLRVNDTAMSLNPILPPGASMVTLRSISYLGQRLDITYTATNITVSLAPAAPESVAPRTHIYAVPPAVLPTAVDEHLTSLLPVHDLPSRSQMGQVVVGARIAPRSLSLVDAAGRAFPITSSPTTVPLQPVAIVPAAGREAAIVGVVAVPPLRPRDEGGFPTSLP